MESSGLIPRSRVELGDLAALFGRRGPFATVFLATDPEVDNASFLSEKRWRALRADMESGGVPARVLGAIDPLVPDAHLAGSCLAVIADAEGVLHAESNPEPPVRDLWRWGALPSVVTLVEWRQASPPHVVVLADRHGADLIAYRGTGAPLAGEVSGDSHPVTKAASGGWSQRHHHARVEENWQHTADRVCQEVQSLVEATGACLLAIGGDVRAVQALEQALPAELSELVVEISGTRAPDGSDDETAGEVVRQVASVVASETVATLEKFREEAGEGRRAADGPEATFAALAMSQVGLLLVGDDPGDDRAAWFGPEPGQVGLTDETLKAMGVAEPQQARLLDVAVRAALGTGGDVRVVPSAGGPTGGLGAILRWS